MGADKATLTLQGTPMAHLVMRALFDAGVGAVVLVGEDIPDRWPGEGPLGGLATAVLHGAATDGVEIVVVAACDQPDLAPELLAALVASLHAAPDDAVASAVRTADGRLHPFPSAWRSSASEALAALVDAGERRADAAFTCGPIIELPAAPESVADLDTPADVARWIARRGRANPEPPENRT
jgi:molybdopterin-guanine dinucleotide biosynthesis protein A